MLHKNNLLIYFFKKIFFLKAATMAIQIFETFFRKNFKLIVHHATSIESLAES